MKFEGIMSAKCIHNHFYAVLKGNKDIPQRHILIFQTVALFSLWRVSRNVMPLLLMSLKLSWYLTTGKSYLEHHTIEKQIFTKGLGTKYLSRLNSHMNMVKWHIWWEENTQLQSKVLKIEQSCGKIYGNHLFSSFLMVLYPGFVQSQICDTWGNAYPWVADPKGTKEWSTSLDNMSTS